MAKINLTNRELLVRLDERQQGILKKLGEISDELARKVDDDSDYKELKTKVDSLWDSRNKLIGWLFGAGVAGGAASTILRSLITEIFAR